MSVEAGDGLVTAQQLRETFHDMRQPVAITMALAAAALTEPDLPAAARGRIERIVEQAEWLGDMIADCLVPREQDRSDDLEEPGHLADIVHVVSEVTAAESMTWPGDVSLTAPAGPVWCTLPLMALRRAVCNLLDNATRAAGPAGAVTVEIQQHQDGVMLAVEDNGPGFGEIPNGAGLGLSSVASHVVRYGGKLECSSGVRGGARVTLWLPLIPYRFLKSKFNQGERGR